MESPLNSAHQQSRKADMMLKCKKYEEAMLCHRRAADYLLEAMETTTSELAQESIYHQHQFHLRQQDNLQHKLDREELQQYNKLDRAELQHNKAPVVRHNQSTQTDDNVNDEAVLHAMSDTDSVLGFLVNRNRTQDFSVMYRPEKQFVNVKKIPRDNSDLIEELRVKNEELEKQVLYLSRQVSELKAENKFEHDPQKVTKIPRKDIFDIEEERGSVDFGLPPLEMPQFDFDSLKGQMTSDTENPLLFENE